MDEKHRACYPSSVYGGDTDIVLWVVNCYLTWIGTHITNTELLREDARFGHLNISRNCSWTGFRWTLGSMMTCSRREKSLLPPRSEPWSSSISVPLISTQATRNLINLRESDIRNAQFEGKAIAHINYGYQPLKKQRLVHQHINHPRKLQKHLNVSRHSLNKRVSLTALTCWSS